METVIISYSLSGNNDKLAESLAKALSAKHLRVTEEVERTNGKIALDMMFNKKPKINADLSVVKAGDNVIFTAPVWMGAVAAPLRTCLHDLKPKLTKYSFVTISGGALGPNPKIEAELTKRTGIKPSAVIDMQIVNLIKGSEKPTREQTSAYKVTDEDIKMLSKEAVEKLEQNKDDCF